MLGLQHRVALALDAVAKQFLHARVVLHDQHRAIATVARQHGEEPVAVDRLRPVFGGSGA